MGLSTSAVLDQGLEQAGDPSLRGPALIGLNLWLNSRAHERLRLGYPVIGTAFPIVTLGASVPSIIIGGATSTYPSFATINAIHIDDLWLALPGVKPPTNRIRILEKQTGNVASYNPGQASSTSPGMPLVANVLPIGPDVNGLQGLQLFFNPIPAQSYDMYLYVAGDNRLADTQDLTTSFPWYPNSETIVKWVELWAVRHMAAASDRPIDEQRIKRIDAEYRELLGADRSMLTSSPDDEVWNLNDSFFGGIQIYNPGITRR